MNGDEFKERAHELLYKERQTGSAQWMYLSFADESLKRFNGAVVVKAYGILDAVSICHSLGISPGGQVVGGPLPDELLPGPDYRNRLLSKEDVSAIWPDAKTVGEFEKEEQG